MNNLPNFLRKYSCGKEDGPNWGSLRGGRYKIPKEHKSTFFKLVSTAAPQWTAKKINYQSLVFRPTPTQRALVKFVQSFNRLPNIGGTEYNNS